MEMLIGENGATLGLLPERLSNAATALVESLKISVISEEVRRKRPVMVKRRTGTSEQITEMANFYFSWCGLPIRLWSKIGDWRRWEIESFNRLNSDRFRAHASGERCVIEDKLPGERLWEHMNGLTLTKEMLAAAGQKLYRAHQFGATNLRTLVSWRRNHDERDLQLANGTSAADRFRDHSREDASCSRTSRRRSARFFARYGRDCFEPAMVALRARVLASV